MKFWITGLLVVTFSQCSETNKISCNKKFFRCADECRKICERTIRKSYEFGRCFTICNTPCRKEFCKKI